MLAQIDPELPPQPVEIDPSAFFLFWAFQGVFSVLSLVLLALKIWMIIDCLRKDPDRYFWFWIILIVPFGELVYFFVRWVPGRQLRMPKALKRWTGSKELTRLEIAAMQIGNPHQFIQYGDALREAGHNDRAGQAYREALEKDPKNTQALWGAAQVEMIRKNFAAAVELLDCILKIDPQYKFGDVSLAYGKALHELGRRDEAFTHLEAHVRRWRHPEALFLLATIDAEKGNTREARTQLQGLLLDINGSPTAIARRQANWKSRARKLLRKLPPA